LPPIRIEALSATIATRRLARQSQVSAQPAQLRHDRAPLPGRAPHGVAHRHGGRRAIVAATLGASTATARQYTLRIKSLLSYGHELGYMPFNAGVRIKVPNDAGNRGASLAKRIMAAAEVALLIRAARFKRDRILVEVAYAGGLRVSEIVNLTWADVLPRDNGLVQLSILGKGEKPRQVLLPDIVSRSLLTLRGDAGANDPVFASRKGGRLTARAVHGMVKRTAARAGVNAAISRSST